MTVVDFAGAKSPPPFWIVIVDVGKVQMTVTRDVELNIT